MTILCQVCGTPNLEGTTYCEGCGVELSAAPESQPTAAPETLPQEMPQETLPQAASSGAQEVAGASEIVATTQIEAPVSGPDVHAEVMSPPEPAPGDVTPLDAPPVETSSEVPEPEGEVSGASVIAPAAPVAELSSDAPAPAGEARLGIKKYGAPTGEFIPLQGERLVVGRFDASSGPVDIDLSGLGGQEHISRRHAELYREQGRWAVRDLGSTNGVYVKRKGETSFSPRLQEPTSLTDGDELAFGNLVLTFHQG